VGVLIVTLVVCALALAALRAPLLRLMGHYLVAETPLEPAAAIVVLAGGMPLRETEGA